MDTVTYPDDKVRAELSHWVVLRVDITARRRVAGLLDVRVVPVAVALTADGDELGRIPNFVKPDEFQKQLARLRS